MDRVTPELFMSVLNESIKSVKSWNDGIPMEKAIINTEGYIDIYSKEYKSDKNVYRIKIELPKSINLYVRNAEQFNAEPKQAVIETLGIYGMNPKENKALAQIVKKNLEKMKDNSDPEVLFALTKMVKELNDAPPHTFFALLDEEYLKKAKENAPSYYDYAKNKLEELAEEKGLKDYIIKENHFSQSESEDFANSFYLYSNDNSLVALIDYESLKIEDYFPSGYTKEPIEDEEEEAEDLSLDL